MNCNRTSQSSFRYFSALAASIAVFRFAAPAQAQFRDYGTPGLGAGVKVGGVLGKTDLSDKADIQVRGYLSHGLTRTLSGEVGAGYAALAGRDYRTDMGLVDFRFLFTPFQFTRVSPFLFAGAGALRYDLDRIPGSRTPGANSIDWAGMVPVGAGMKVKLTERLSVDLSGGYTHTYSDVLDASALKAGRDVYWGAKIGFDLGRHPDPDRDGLYARAEKRLGTNPKVKDSDGDGLSDGEEARKYGTNPLAADSDGDGVGDGLEVARGTNPLSTARPVAKAGAADSKAAPPTQASGQQGSIRQEGRAAHAFQTLYFDFDSYGIRDDQKAILLDHAAQLQAAPGSKLSLEGHCDERGTTAYNLALGQKRADSARRYLVNSGIPAERLTTVSYGKERPAAPGHGEAVWAKNRRVEFVPVVDFQAFQE